MRRRFSFCLNAFVQACVRQCTCEITCNWPCAYAFTLVRIAEVCRVVSCNHNNLYRKFGKCFAIFFFFQDLCMDLINHFTIPQFNNFIKPQNTWIHSWLGQHFISHIFSSRPFSPHPPHPHPFFHLHNSQTPTALFSHQIHLLDNVN